MQLGSETGLNSLPTDVLGLVRDDLSVAEVLSFPIPNKKFRSVFRDNLYWEKQLKIHYPNYYEEYKSREIKNWFVVFNKCYALEHKKVGRDVIPADRPLIMKLIMAVRSGNLGALKLINNLGYLLQRYPLKDLNGKNIFQTAKDKGYQNISDYLYKILKKLRDEADLEDFKVTNASKVNLISQVNFLKLIIATHQSKDVFESRWQLTKDRQHYFRYPIEPSEIWLSSRKQTSLLRTAIHYQNVEILDHLLDKGVKVKGSHLIPMVKYNLEIVYHHLQERLGSDKLLKIIDGLKRLLLTEAVRANQTDWANKLLKLGATLPSERYIIMAEDEAVVEPNNKEKSLTICAMNGNYSLFKNLWDKDPISVSQLTNIAIAALHSKQTDFLKAFLKDLKFKGYGYLRGLLDECFDVASLQDEHKEIIHIFVDNGWSFASRQPLREHIKGSGLHPDLLPIFYKKEIEKLTQYIQDRKNDPREFYFSFFGKKCGFSSEDKIAAAQALIDLLSGKIKDLSKLTLPQWAALHQGDLGTSIVPSELLVI